jgi:hypothetical protein
MTEWGLIAVGLTFVGLMLAWIKLFPRSPWTAVLLRSYGVGGAGPRGTYTRRHRFRSAVLSIALAVVLLALSALAYAIADRFPNLSRGNWIAGAYGFSLFVLAGIAALSAIVSFWRGVTWRREEADQGWEEDG